MALSTTALTSWRKGFLLMGALQIACGGSPSGPSTQNGITVSLTRIDITSADGGPLMIEPGQSLQLKALATYSTGEPQDVTSTVVWRSSDPATGVVGVTGLVQAARIGGLDIT